MAETLRDRLLREAAGATPVFVELAQRMHAHPEVGLEEQQAADWLANALREAGFAVTQGIADLPTAFVAGRGEAQARPVIAFLAEYDALPGLGHACGHNLIAGAGCLAAVALARVLSPERAQVRLIGCPAEESYAGKAQLVDQGVFSDVDVALMAHGHFQHVTARPGSGRKSVVVEFHGRPAHAAVAPETAVNALDAMILTFSAVGLLRQQLRAEARVHGVITHGGEAANIVPDYTRAEFYVRSFDAAYLEELATRLIACAQGAAEATGARLETSAATLTMLPVKRNRVLEGVYERNLLSLGETLGTDPSNRGAVSTDFGNVSHAIPGLHAYFKVADAVVRSHTREFAEAARSAQGVAGMIAAAKSLALTGLDLIEQPDLLAAVREEFAHPRDA